VMKALSGAQGCSARSLALCYRKAAVLSAVCEPLHFRVISYCWKASLLPGSECETLEQWSSHSGRMSKDSADMPAQRMSYTDALLH